MATQTPSERQEGAGNNPYDPEQQSAADFLSTGRGEPHPNKLTQLMFAVFKVCFGSLGLWVNHWWSYVPRTIVSLLCIYQAIYYMCVVLGCKDFDCRLPDQNAAHHKADRPISNAVDTIATLGAALSYGFFVFCFILAEKRDSALVSPAYTMAKNLDNKDALQLCVYFVSITAFYLGSVVVFFVIQPSRESYIPITGVASQFLAQWTAITTCHVFAVSSYTLGTKHDTLKLVHLCLIFVCHLYLFLVPCIFAARITSCCTVIYDVINVTISSEWNEGHPFRDRSNTALFLSYAKDRQCGFKIGGIRFNTCLTWLSLFFGITGLLYHFV